jgi:type VI protein secretion system component VasF
MLNRTIEPIAAESTSLELHTELCAARYQQITDVLNTIDHRLIQMDSDLILMRDMIVTNQDRLHDRIFAWGSAIIVALAGMVGWLTVHYILP